MKKKNRKLSRVFSSLLSTLLILSSVPVSVFAQDVSAVSIEKDASTRKQVEPSDSIESHFRNLIPYQGLEDSIDVCTLTEGEPAESEGTSTYNLSVGNTTITAANASDIFGDGTVSYDSETQTLTLNNATITTSYDPEADSAFGIYCESDLTIHLIGSNTITAPNAIELSYGIYVFDNLTLAGSGSLNVTSGDVNFTATESNDYCESTAISAESITIEGVSVAAVGGNATGAGTGQIDDTIAYSIGIYVDDTLIIQNGARIQASAKTATAPKSRSFGIEMNGLFSMKNATATITASTSAGVISSRSMGLYGPYEISIDKDSVLNTVSGDVSGNDAHTYALHCYSNDEATIIIDGQITAHAGNATSSKSAFSVGFFTCHDVEISETGSIEAISGESTSPNAQSQGMQILRGTLHIMGGSLTVKSGEVVGIPAENEDSNVNSTGIYIIGNFFASDGAHLTAIGNKSNGDIAYSNGVAIKDGSVTIHHATLMITAGEVNGKVRSGSIGVELINNSDSFYVYDNAAAITITSSNATSDTKAYSNAICGYRSDIGFAGGNITLTTGQWNAPKGDAYAVYSGGETDDEGDISGGYIHFSCDERTIDPTDYHIIGTHITASAPYSDVFYARCGIELDEAVTFSTPAEYQITGHGDYDSLMEFYEYYTLTDMENNPVKTAILEPKTYTVTIKDGVSADSENLIVPAGFSVNETYCERYEINDFAERYKDKQTGYQLDGFYFDQAYTESSKYAFTETVTEDITLYAKWTKLNANTNNGNTGTTAPKTADHSQILMWGLLMILSAVALLKKRNIMSI